MGVVQVAASHPQTDANITPSAHDHNNQDRAQKGGRTVGGLVERQTGKVVVASAVRGGVEEVLRELVAGLLRRRADKDRHVGPRHVVEL